MSALHDFIFLLDGSHKAAGKYDANQLKNKTDKQFIYIPANSPCFFREARSLKFFIKFPGLLVRAPNLPGNIYRDKSSPRCKPVILGKLHTNPSNYSWVDPKEFRKVCMEFSKHNWATISETICPEMLIFDK